MLFVNFKTYPLGTSEAAVRLAQTCFQVAAATGVEIVPIVQVVDLYRVHQEVGEHLWTQHVDGIGYGPHTGWILPAAVRDSGAAGTLLNHSEHKLEQDKLTTAVQFAKRVGLQVLFCASSLEELKSVTALKPDFIAYEPPELIGTTTSVSQAKPEIIKQAVSLLPHGIPLIVGAGIHASTDVTTALQLGATGVLVSSDILTADHPQEELEDLAQALK